jgi:DNA-binding MarR family transcriptional regulator
MTRSGAAARSNKDKEGETREPQPRQVGLGRALSQAWVGYRRRLDQELAAAGFDDRRFPDRRVLRICSSSTETTISQIGRELGITRQGASKIVASLRARSYVTLIPSATDGREKIVKLTPRATEYLAAQRKAARRIERQMRADVGAEGFDSLHRLLKALGGDEQPRMLDYLPKSKDLDSLRYPGD